MTWKRLSILCAASIFMLYAGLILSLFYFFRGDVFHEAIMSERTWAAIRLSLSAATAATLLSVLLGLPAAYALSRHEFPGKKMIDTMLELPMIVSPAALGAMLLIFFNTPAGQLMQEWGLQFVFSPAGVILAQFITTAGVATRLIKAALDEIPKRYEDVARTMGASPLVAFTKITFPLCRRGILAAAILTWAKALGEFGATITLAGTMAMRTETLPIAIYMQLSTANIEGTVSLILILTTLGFFTLFAVHSLTGRRRNV